MIMVRTLTQVVTNSRKSRTVVEPAGLEPGSPVSVEPLVASQQGYTRLLAGNVAASRRRMPSVRANCSPAIVLAELVQRAVARCTGRSHSC